MGHLFLNRKYIWEKTFTCGLAISPYLVDAKCALYGLLLIHIIVLRSYYCSIMENNKPIMWNRYPLRWKHDFKIEFSYIDNLNN